MVRVRYQSSRLYTFWDIKVPSRTTVQRSDSSLPVTRLLLRCMMTICVYDHTVCVEDHSLLTIFSLIIFVCEARIQ